MESVNDLEFEQLTSRLIDRGLVTSEQRRLESLLKGHPDRQKRYLDCLATHLLLEKEGALQADVEVLPVTFGKEFRKSKHHLNEQSGAKRSNQSRNYKLGFAWAAILLVAVGGLAVYKLLPSSEPLMAKVIDSTDVVGAPTELSSEGSFIDIGLPLHFESGLLAIKMPTGAEFVLEGPASLTVQGKNHVLLESGKLYAKVPLSGHGFRVDTQATSIVDLGTEFGVVATANGLTKSYVYDGLVEAKTKDQSFLLKAAMTIAASTDKGLGQPRRFKLSEISFKNSLDGTSYIDQVKYLNPLYFHRFSSSNRRRSLSDELGQDKYNANIKGGVYVSTGGPVLSPHIRDGHLRFVGVESVAEIGSADDSIRNTEAYTIMLWVRVDEEGPQGIAAFTNDLGPDAFLGQQLRITEDDRLEHSCRLINADSSSDSSVLIQRSHNRIERGVWHHVAVTGGTSRDLNLYLNGKRASQSIKMPGVIVADCSRLLLGSGSGRSGEEAYHTGPLRGAIDELVIFDRCLDAAEVSQVYKTAVNSSDMDSL